VRSAPIHTPLTKALPLFCEYATFNDEVIFVPVITKITTQQKNKERYNIFMDDGSGEKYAFSVDEAVLIKHQLKKGMEIDDLLLTEIHYDDDIRKTYNLALRYLANRMRSELEVRTYLEGKEAEPPVIQEVILKLYEYQFLDDEQYAISYVRTQINTADKGPILIKRELVEKGIKESWIDHALLEFSYELQLEKAQKICSKLGGTNKKDSARVLKQKMEQMLFRKGYHSAIISEATEKELSERTDEEKEAIMFQINKLERKYQQYEGYEYEQKMKTALFRKGFSLDQIEAYLSQRQHEDE
jgi:regulatory protein